MATPDVPARWVEMGAQALQASDFDRYPVGHYWDDAEIPLIPVLADLRRQVEALRTEAADDPYPEQIEAYDKVLDLLATGGSDE